MKRYILFLMVTSVVISSCNFNLTDKETTEIVPDYKKTTYASDGILVETLSTEDDSLQSYEEQYFNPETLQVTQVQLYTASRDLIAIYRYGYNEDGRVSFETRYNPQGVFMYAAEYRYTDDGYLTDRIRYKMSGDNTLYHDDIVRIEREVTSTNGMLASGVAFRNTTAETSQTWEPSGAIWRINRDDFTDWLFEASFVREGQLLSSLPEIFGLSAAAGCTADSGSILGQPTMAELGCAGLVPLAELPVVPVTNMPDLLSVQDMYEGTGLEPVQYRLRYTGEENNNAVTTVTLDDRWYPLAVAHAGDSRLNDKEFRSSFEYDEAGRISRKVSLLRNNLLLDISLEYDDSDRITRILASGETLQVPLDFAVGYDEENRVQSLQHTLYGASMSVAFDYSGAEEAAEGFEDAIRSVDPFAFMNAALKAGVVIELYENGDLWQTFEIETFGDGLRAVSTDEEGGTNGYYALLVSSGRYVALEAYGEDEDLVWQKQFGYPNPFLDAYEEFTSLVDETEVELGKMWEVYAPEGVEMDDTTFARQYAERFIYDLIF